MHSPSSSVSSTVGVVLAFAGVVQILAALALAADLLSRDAGGGLFGFRIGTLTALVVCVPWMILGVLCALGGIGASRRQPRGYVISIIAAVLYAAGALVSMMVALGMPGSDGQAVAMLAALVLAMSVAVVVVMVRANTARES